MFLSVGDHERLRDEVMAFYVRNSNKGSIQLRIYERGVHDFQYLSFSNAQNARTGYEQISEFMQNVLNGVSTESSIAKVYLPVSVNGTDQPAQVTYLNDADVFHTLRDGVTLLEPIRLSCSSDSI
jgi:hypothetical protein